MKRGARTALPGAANRHHMNFRCPDASLNVSVRGAHAILICKIPYIRRNALRYGPRHFCSQARALGQDHIGGTCARWWMAPCGRSKQPSDSQSYNNTPINQNETTTIYYGYYLLWVSCSPAATAPESKFSRRWQGLTTSRARQERACLAMTMKCSPRERNQWRDQ